MNEKKYFAGIRDMAVAMIDWAGQHSTERVVITFPISNVSYIGTVADGKRFGVFKVNDAAERMLKELGFLDYGGAAPTVLMLKTALALMDESAKRAMGDRR